MDIYLAKKLNEYVWNFNIHEPKQGFVFRKFSIETILFYHTDDILWTLYNYNNNNIIVNICYYLLIPSRMNYL